MCTWVCAHPIPLQPVHTPKEKVTEMKLGGWGRSVVEYLPNMHKALGSNISIKEINK